jgi:tryptophan-rich sensory protein
MDISDHLKDPVWAALFAAAVTAGYVYVKNQMNGGEEIQMSAYAKPAVLVALLVYFIVYSGSSRETISRDPF